MMRGINADVTLIEPGEKVEGGLLCYLIHTNRMNIQMTWWLCLDKEAIMRIDAAPYPWLIWR